MSRFQAGLSAGGVENEPLLPENGSATSSIWFPQLQQAMRAAPALRRVTTSLLRPAPRAHQLRQAWGEAPGLAAARTQKGWPSGLGLGKAAGLRGMALRCPTRPTILEDQERAAAMTTLSESGYEPPAS